MSVTRVARVGTGEVKSKIDGVGDAFWSGDINNPLGVIIEDSHQIKLTADPREVA